MDRLSASHDFVAGIDVFSDRQRLATLKCTGRNLVHAHKGIDLKPTSW